MNIASYTKFRCVFVPLWFKKITTEAQRQGGAQRNNYLNEL